MIIIIIKILFKKFIKDNLGLSNFIYNKKSKIIKINNKIAII